ncbi:MAG: SGNH/GDSL hydrolase family protein [Oscillospiraceae bacterium]|nr:SGNH/GDSL hydrolase family protein [Oscillospiraceae bacterium]
MGEKHVFRACEPARQDGADTAAVSSQDVHSGESPAEQTGRTAAGLFEVSDATIKVNRATRAGRRKLYDVEREVGGEDPFAALEPLETAPLEQEDTPELPEVEKTARTVEKKKKTGAARKKTKKKKPGLAGWLTSSKKNLALGIGAGALCLALAAGLVFVCARAIRNQTAEAPSDTYVETLDVDPDAYADVLLAKTSDAGEKYLNETLFIGDSNTARLSMYGYLTLDNVIGIESMGVEDVVGSKCVYFKGYDNPVTIPEAVAMMKPRRIIINFGTNDIMTNDVDEFIGDYKTALAAIQKAYGYSDIIISAIPPLGSNRSNQKLTMEIVDEYNLALLDFAKENGLTFLNISETLKGSDGWMRSDYVIEDGIHMSRTALEALLRYVRTHSHVVDDARPKPLGDIPARRSAPVIVTDEPELNTGTVVSLAYDMFSAAGFGRITDSDDKTEAVRLEYAIPLETEAGEEQNVAGYFYNFVLKQTTFKKAKVQLSGEKKDTTYSFYAVVIPQYCETHTYGEGKITKEATCVTDGVKTYTCSVCGYQKTEPIPALGHDYLEITEYKENPTCTKEGKHVYVCQRASCTDSTADHVKTEVIPALGHSLTGAVTVTTAATCTATGTGTQLCSRCNQTIAVVIPMIPHNYTSAVTTAATCTTAGVRTYTCTVCGATYTEAIPATGHTYVGGVCSACGQADPNYVAPSP